MMLLRERPLHAHESDPRPVGADEITPAPGNGLAIEQLYIPDPQNERLGTELAQGRGRSRRTTRHATAAGESCVSGHPGDGFKEPDLLGELRARFGAAPIILFLLLLLAGNLGCGNDFSLSDSPSLLDPFSHLDLSAEPSGDEAAENSSFVDAQAIPVTQGANYTLRGALTGETDIDVYDAGPLAIGDRLVAEVFPESGLSAAIALFDENGYCLLVNDSRNAFQGRLEPFVDVVARREMAHAYLVVTSTPGNHSGGGYTLAVRVNAGEPVPAPRPQTILLNFHGAKAVGFGGRPDIDIPPFDAANISTNFSGLTVDVATRITARVREDFTGLNVRILSTFEGAQADNRTSRIHFGTSDPALLGVAQSVDEYNSELRQDAIVFTDTFAAFNPLNPTVEEIAQAVANVASHEIGHLLGLVHTSAAEDLMDITASLSQLLLDQSFGIAPLHPAVFATGFQNSPMYLEDSVGRDATGRKLDRWSVLLQRAAAAGLRPAGSPDLPRTGLHFGTCGRGPRHPED